MRGAGRVLGALAGGWLGVGWAGASSGGHAFVRFNSSGSIY